MASLVKRGKTYYLQFRVNGSIKRRSLRTDSLQIAKERKRAFESAQFRGDAVPLVTRTPVGEVLTAYFQHAAVHRRKTWQKDLTYYRDMFGECCPELELAPGRATKCRDLRLPEDRRRKAGPIEVSCIEDLTTAQVGEFIAQRVRLRGLAPKTANRYREIAAKLINWAMETGRVRMPQDRNPVTRVARYREPAPEIRFLTLPQIDEQLTALESSPLLRVMVGTLIYAGLRREELTWLQMDDLVAASVEAPNGLLRVRAKTVDGANWQPKTAKNRVVPVSRTLRVLLDGWLTSHHGGNWLFPSPQGRRWDKDNFSRALGKINRRAGLPWTCLDYRHTFGSQLAQRGVSLFQIATLMGNSPEICRRHYAHLSPELLQQAVEFSGN